MEDAVITNSPKDRMMISKKVIVIGLDGASFEMIKSWICKGKLPTLANLVKTGVFGPLRSTIPPITGPAWVSFATGKNPGKHGIYAFTEILESDNKTIINSTMVDSERIWNILDKNGKKSYIINLPVTFPPEKLKGIMISSFLTPPGAKNYCYPHHLKRELEKIGYRIDVKFEKFGFIPHTHNTIRSRNNLYAECLEIEKKRTEIAKKLAKKDDWDFFFVLFKGTDNILHLFWDEKKKVLDYFTVIDGYIGEILNASNFYREENTTVFIMSDHGFDRAANGYFNINAWLRREGFTHTKTNPIAFTFWRALLKVHSFFIKWLDFDFSVFKIIREWVFYQTRATKGYSSLQHLKTLTWFGLCLSEEAKRSVKDYEELRFHLINKLKSLKDPSGEHVISEIYKKEDVYNGKHIISAPDIVFLTKPSYYVNINPYYEEIFSPRVDPHPSGDHSQSRMGLLIANGPGIAKGGKITGADIIDLVPTILHIFNIPIPREMDGKVLKKLFQKNTDLAKKQIEYEEFSTHKNTTHKKKRQKLSMPDQDKVRDRLKQLGYL